MKQRFLLKMVLVAAGLFMSLNGAWAGDKTVTKYSFDNATSPSVTVGNGRSTLDYSHTSVVTSTVFLNIYDNANNHNADTNISFGEVGDLTEESWTLDFYWGANSGANNRPGYTYLYAGSTKLFTITDPSNSATKLALTYGESGSINLNVPVMNKSARFSAATGNLYNTTNYWYHFVVTGDKVNGVRLTVAACDGSDPVADGVVLSEVNVTPTAISLRPAACGAVGIDDLLLSYSVEGEVIQTPVAAYTEVNGISRTITATCDTEGADVYYSLDNTSWTKGASVTVDASCNIYFKGVKGTSESDVLTFAVEAGTTIQLNAPLINRTSNTQVTISADQSNLLLSPTATIYYEYGDEIGSFTGSKTLTVAADATITAYAEATGYVTSETSTKAVALWPNNLETIENTAAKTSGWSTNVFSAETVTASERTYAALLLDDVQWGKNIYLQTDGSWGLRATGNWYINSHNDNSWILMQDMKAGDIILVDVTYPASDMVNATTCSKYSYGTKHVYEVTEDGDVELAFRKIDAGTMDYFYGIYAYRTVTSVPATIGTAGYATFASTFALDLANLPEGVTAYKAVSVDASTITFESLDQAVPANTGILLKGAAGKIAIPVAASGTAVDDNLLEVNTTGEVFDAEAGYSYYGLQKDQKTFAQFNPATVAIPANKAYLKVATYDARELAISFGEGDVTGIEKVESAAKNAGVVYNLAGQRVAQPQKGLYIVNGKKAIVK